MPDNQEVFAHAATDVCVIIELLQYEAEVSDAESARHFFDEIAGSNGCGPADVSVLLAEASVSGDKAPKIDAPHAASVIVGDQRVAKFKEGDDAKNVVRVYLGNVRYACRSGWRRWSWCSSSGAAGVMTTRCVQQTAGRDDGRGRLGVGAHAHQPGEQQQRRVPAGEQLRSRRGHLHAGLHVLRRARLVALPVTQPRTGFSSSDGTTRVPINTKTRDGQVAERTKACIDNIRTFE